VTGLLGVPDVSLVSKISVGMSNHYSVAELYIFNGKLLDYACSTQWEPITVPEVSLNANDFYSLRLPAQRITYPQICFR
jgi:hypothetical protein